MNQRETDRDKLISQVVRMYREFNIGYDPAVKVLRDCGLSEVEADRKLLMPEGGQHDDL